MGGRFAVSVLQKILAAALVSGCASLGRGNNTPPGVTIAAEDLYADHRNLFPHGGSLVDSESAMETPAIIPGGMRAVSYVPPDGLPVKAGMYVDLWWNPPNGPACAVAQAILVLAPRRRLERLEEGHSLLLSQEQIPAVLEAMDHPSFRMASRNDLDADDIDEVECSS